MGFMGCGKTTVGSLLAEKLNCPFKDTDAIIEKKIGLSIFQIFEKQGEEKFRYYEKEVISEICQLHNQIIALGGGAVLSSENWNKISSTGFTITLSFSPEILISRLKQDSKRPLLHSSNNRMQLIKELIEKRQSYYHKADLYLHFDSAPESDIIVKKIISHLISKKIV